MLNYYTNKENWRITMDKKQGNIKIMFRMMGLVKPLALPMCFAILLGVLGFICAIGIPVLSAMAVLQLRECILIFLYNQF